MFSPKLLEAWFTLTAEAMRGAEEAQEAFQTLSELSNSPEDLRHWMAKYLPAGVSSTSHLQPETFEDQLEDWWRLMGMTPRSRYLELLEKYDLLQRRLERAEETIRHLQARLSEQARQEQEGKKAIDMWHTMMEETLKAQMEWVNAWTAVADQAGPEPDKSRDTGVGETVSKE